MNDAEQGLPTPVERILADWGKERVALPPTVRTAVMARVRAAATSPWRRAWRWAIAPRLSPLAGALAVAAVLAVVLLRPRHPDTVGAPSTARFVFVAPQAHTVAITGDWVHWDPAGIALRSPGHDGVWVGEIAVPPGLHHYVFIVNGTEWRPDPNAASQVDDGFGRQNSVLLVPATRAS